MGNGVSVSKHEAILEGALDLFLEKGYPGTSMDEIAAKAGVSKQTVYKHFADKQRLFSEILLATTDEVENLVRWTLEEFEDPQEADVALDRLARRFLYALMEPRLLRLRRLIIANADRFPDLGRTWYESGFERILNALAECFRRLNDLGFLNVRDPLLAAHHFVGMLLWIPINKAMFTGDEQPFADKELQHLAKTAAAAFLQAYGTEKLQRPSTSGKIKERSVKKRNAR